MVDEKGKKTNTGGSRMRLGERWRKGDADGETEKGKGGGENVEGRKWRVTAGALSSIGYMESG